MREMNQYLYREVNTVQVSNYVDIDRDRESSTVTTTTATNRTMESYLADVQQGSYQVTILKLLLHKDFDEIQLKTRWVLLVVEKLASRALHIQDSYILSCLAQLPGQN